MKKKTVTLVSFILFILVIVFYSVYPYLAQLEAPSWMLQTTFYALMTAIFSFVFLGVLAPKTREWLEQRKAKRSKEETALKGRIVSCQSCRNQIEYNISNHVKQNEFGYGDVNVRSNLSTEAEKKVEEYIRRYEVCGDWLKATEYVIPQILQSLIKYRLPETAKTGYALDSDLSEPALLKRYVNGEEVNVTWLKGNKPGLLDNIRKNLKDNELRFDNFFIELNAESKNNKVLNRFRNDKKALIEFGNQIMNDLKLEQESLEKEHSQFE